MSQSEISTSWQQSLATAAWTDAVCQVAASLCCESQCYQFEDCGQQWVSEWGQSKVHSAEVCWATDNTHCTGWRHYSTAEVWRRGGGGEYYNRWLTQQETVSTEDWTIALLMLQNINNKYQQLLPEKILSYTWEKIICIGKYFSISDNRNAISNTMEWRPSENENVSVLQVYLLRTSVGRRHWSSGVWSEACSVWWELCNRILAWPHHQAGVSHEVPDTRTLVHTVSGGSLQWEGTQHRVPATLSHQPLAALRAEPGEVVAAACSNMESQGRWLAA